MAGIIQNIVDMVGFFADAAKAFPLSVLLLAMGFVLVTGSVVVFGYLTAGAVFDWLIPERAARPPAQRR